MKRAVPLFLLILTVALTANAESTPVPVVEWLRLGPDSIALPAFHDEDPGTFGLDQVLAEPGFDVASLSPVDGADGWRALKTKDDRLELKAEGAAEIWLAAYVTVDHWMEVDFAVDAAHPAQTYVDGAKIDLKEKDEARSAALKLARGTHMIVLHLLHDPAVEDTWSIGASFSSDDESLEAALRVGIDPQRAVTIHDVLDYPKISSIALSPDGGMVVVALGAYDTQDHRERWLEIRDVKSGDLIDTWRGGRNPGRVQWHPGGGAVSYTSSQDEATTVWYFDLKTRAVTSVTHGLKDFEGYSWNPDGASIVVSLGVEAEAEENGMKRLQAIEDRWTWWRNRSYLTEITWPEGRSRRLTAGDVGVGGWSFSPDGESMIFSRTFPEPTVRPYSRTEWFEMNLATLEAVRILQGEDYWLNEVIYGPDRGTLLITGSPSAFDGIGRDLPDDVVPNDYGGQLFIYDRENASAKTLSRDFDPTVQQITWHRPSKRIVARVLDTQYVRLASCSLDGVWNLYDAGVEVVAGWKIANAGKTVVAYGTSADSPQKLMTFTLKGRSARLLHDYAAARYAPISFGRVENYVAILPDGMELDGRVHYPRDYEPGRKYPVIVYYYGGTSPITRDFGGRYPKNIWAAEGYFIYIPNPSGALGYGQEFAARHVNDWGRLTAGEVIEGTQAFLATYPDADSENVGCIGASYGGFLTMTILTQTDIFAAGISHAGISNISSYWAEGYWGYAYGARALANSFPWNDRELYVEQSALFHADKITTPLLLLHGFADTNVPKGESDGLYIALKMLDRDVEYIQIQEQDHHILDHEKRILWNDTILAYFNWKLKGRGARWDNLSH